MAKVAKVAKVTTCSNCMHWRKLQSGEQGNKAGLGQCRNVPNWYGASDPDTSEYTGPESDYTHNVKPKRAHLKAFAIDGTGYKAELLTAPDFGCVSFLPRNSK